MIRWLVYIALLVYFLPDYHVQNRNDGGFVDNSEPLIDFSRDTNFKLISIEANGLVFSAIEGMPSEEPHDTVLFVHGFPDNFHSFKHQMKFLVEKGYRVISPAIRGYEPSSQPANRDYFLLTLASDVLAWLDALKISKVHIVGHDWGSIMSLVAALKAPHRFKSLTLIAVPHIKHFFSSALSVPIQFANSWYMLLFQMPWFSEYWMNRNNLSFIDRLWNDWNHNQTWSVERVENVKQTFSKPGVVSAALEYYKQNVLQLAFPNLFSRWPLADEKQKERLAEITKIIETKAKVTTLGLSGVSDRCIDTRIFDYSMLAEDFPSGAMVIKVEDAGHFVHHEQPEKVNDFLLTHLQMTRNNA